MTLAERFWSKVQKTESCWLWTAGKFHNGYGSFKMRRRMHSAHRVAWGLTNGSIPDDHTYHGVCVLHRCDVRACVNPSHLFLGTHADNVADMAAKGRSFNARGSDHQGSKLTDAQVLAIRSDARLQRVIAAEYGLAQTTVGRIRSRRAWAHLEAQ